MRLRHFAITSLVTLAMGIPAVSAAEGLPAEPITIECSDKPLETVLQWISRRAGVNIVCYEQDQPRITLRLANIPWQEAIENIAQKYDLVVEKKSDRVWVLARPPKVSMSFQDASLPVVLEAIARAAEVNIIMAGDVAAGGKKLSMTLKGVPWREALDVVVKTVDLAWVEQNYNIIRIVSPGALQRDLVTRIIPVNYSKAKEVADAMKDVLGSDGTVQEYAGSNSLIVTGTPQAIAKAGQMAERLDQRTRQVLIEMKFVSFSTQDAKKLGFNTLELNFDWDRIGNVTNVFSPFGAVQWGSEISRGETGPTDNRLTKAGLAFEAIATLKTTEILQSPQILAIDNTEAELRIGRELHFAEEEIATQDNGQVIKSLKEASTSPVKDGITIKVKPHITGDGWVGIELEASNEQATSKTLSTGTGENASQITLYDKSQTGVKHQIMAQDGHTVVIGGILDNQRQEQDGKVPYMADIPVLGWLFRNESNSIDKRNLTIFITPRIMPMGEKSQYDQDLESLRARLSGVSETAPAAETKQQAATLGD
jgi:type IV pilus assembly protein PilQ